MANSMAAAGWITVKSSFVIKYKCRAPFNEETRTSRNDDCLINEGDI